MFSDTVCNHVIPVTPKRIWHNILAMSLGDPFSESVESRL